MAPHHYRIMVDALDPSQGEEGLQSLSFFASTHSDIFAAIASLRERMECTACAATKLAVGLGLLSEVMRQQHILLTPLHEPMRELMAALSDSPDGVGCLPIGDRDR
ncbi:MAG TPA: DUF3861 family protein [Acidobacteriaceae bacterium]|nr:DUF3861 family protein [Acidobacteriaceae bacterium]